jgi:hypothetical protein
MAQTLEQLLAEADLLVETRAGGHSKTAAAQRAKPEFADDDIFKLAEQIRTPLGTAKVAAPDLADPAGDDALETLSEKVAWATAINDTLANLPLLVKMAQFEEKARAAGHSDEAIQAQFDKTAGAQKSNLARAAPWLAGGAAGLLTAGAVGHSRGKKKGKDEGRREGAALGFVEGYRRGQSGE